MKYTKVCEQFYHIQVFTSYGKHIYRSFTDTLVMTSLSGTVLRQVKTPVR